MQTYSGGCTCGDIRFIAKGAPDRVGICHCMDCRKHHGALFYAAAQYPITAVAITGSPRAFRGRSFCPRCGSSVFAQSGDEIELHLGAFDAPDQFTPNYECWTTRRETWLAPIPGAAQFPHDPN